jgi:hypothetical protein
MIVRRASLILVLLIAAGSACSNDDHIVGPTRAVTRAEAAQRHASYLCAKALHYPETLASASPTTVGQMRALTGGPSPTGHPWSNLFAGKPGRSFAAWCWRRDGTDSYQSFVVGPGRPLFLDVHVSDVAPAGPPTVT